MTAARTPVPITTPLQKMFGGSRMKFSVIKTLAMGVVLVCSSAYAQDTPATTTSTATTNNAAAQDASSQATIYVYRYKQFVGSALSPSVYCDETELARM